MTVKALLRRWLRPEDRPAFAKNEAGEIEVAFYDDAFSTLPEYRAAYWESRYYFVWTVLCDRLRRRKVRTVLEVGCGPGQLAEMLLHHGFRYFGFDLSPVAIRMARAKKLASARFEVADATQTDLYHTIEHEAVVCTEVLEHLADDLAVVRSIAPGRYCLCTVPSTPYVSHVRYFETVDAVTARYAQFFDQFDVFTLLRPGTKGSRYYLLGGVRNDA